MAKVAIDAGHGMNTAGKRTPAGEREWSFNNVVALACIAKLQYNGVEVLRVDDPTGNTDVPLTTRVNNANNARVGLYVSIHHNANLGTWGTWTGTETFTYEGNNPNSERAAREIHPRLVKAMGLRDRGMKKANFHVLRETNMAAVLTEGGYMDSTIDILKLRDNNVLKAAGEGIADGIMAYFGITPKAPAPTGSTHTVKAGETLWGIATKYGLTVTELKSMNKLTSDVINPGDVLIVGQVATYTVQSGDTLWGIANKHGITVTELKAMNGLTSDVINPGDTLIVKK